MKTVKSLQESRIDYKPKLPHSLEGALATKADGVATSQIAPTIENLFSHISNKPLLSIVPMSSSQKHLPLRVGVVFSGGQASGGHNVITGIFDALQKHHPDSVLIGFCDGPNGIVKNKRTILTEQLLASYRNQGGFDLIGSGRDKIETAEQLAAARQTVESLNLDGLVIIGGDDSNTNAAVLAEYFKSSGCKTSVIGVPKTIDGDLKNEYIEISFGFDTACKTYSEIIGNLLRDALSAKKCYYFVKVMGRSASHIALECALNTHPNLTLISEEVAEKRQTLREVTGEIVDVIISRAALGKEYGLILIPEGIIEFIPEMNVLISELNQLLAQNVKLEEISRKLSAASVSCFEALPKGIQEQLLLTRDSHGNVQVSKIETERLFIELVEKELKRRNYSGKFSAQPFFCGYEGRSGLPSNFDAQYCYALGHVAAVLVNAKANGYICCLRNLTQPVEKWIPCGVPLVNMLTIEQRKGKEKAVIKKALVDLGGNLFALFAQNRLHWAKEDAYRSPGPIQFFGPSELTESIPLTVLINCF